MLLAACGAPSPEDLLGSAKAYLARNDTKAAVIELRNALQKKPDLAEGRFLLGKALLDTPEVGNAAAELKKALTLGYPADTVDPVLAQALVRSGEYRETIDRYQNRSVPDARGMAELRAAVGQAHLSLSEDDAAARDYAAARAADARYGPAILGEAYVAARKGDLDHALQLADAAAEVSPHDPAVWQLRGDVLGRQRKSAPAIASYEKAIAADPTAAGAYAGIIHTLLRDRHIEEADKALDRMAAVIPKSGQTYYMRALVRFAQGRYAEARDVIHQYLPAFPHDASALVLAANIDYEMRAYGEAEDNLLKALQEPGDTDYARRLLIGTYLRRGQTWKAIDALEPLLRTAPQSPQVLNLAGDVYLRHGDPARAAEFFQKAKALDPAGTQQRTGLALSELARGNAAGGLDELQAVVSADPGVRSDLLLISVTLSQGQFDRALKAIAGLEKKQPGTALAANLRGLALLGKKDQAGARGSFERAVSIDPGFLPALVNLARLDAADGHPATGEKRFSDLLQKQPDNAGALGALAELRIRANAPPEEVLVLLRRAAKAAPSNTGPRVALVNYLLQTKQPKEAVAAALEGRSGLGDRPEMLDALGRAQAAAGDLKNAQVTFIRLVEVTSEAPAALLGLGRAQMAMQDRDAAAISLQRALRVRPDFLPAQQALIALHVEQGRHADALAIARDVQKQRPGEAVGFLLEGDILASRKAWPDAAAAYKMALARSSGAEAAPKLHQVLLAAGRTAEAEQFADARVKSHPDDLRFQLYLAERDEASGKDREALRRYERLVAAQPANPVFLNNFAWLAAKLGDPRALEYARRAHALAPNQPNILDTYGTLLVQSGDLAQGIDLLRTAVKLAPENPNIRLHLAKAYVKLGDKAAARAELDRLARLGEDYPAQHEVADLMKSL